MFCNAICNTCNFSFEPPPPLHSAMDEIEEDSCSDADSASSTAQGREDEDDEDEPLLGKWFEDTLFPPEERRSGSKRGGESSSSAKERLAREEKEVDEANPDFVCGGEGGGGAGTLVPDRGEPTGFISLASHVFIFLDKHLLMTQSAYVKNYVYSLLTEQQMTVLAAITRDLDLDMEGSRGDEEALDKGPDPSRLEYHLITLYAEFSLTLANFTHNLLAHNLLTPKLTNSLLHQLGVYPFNSDQEWPLRLYPRTLAILTQVLAYFTLVY